MSLRILITNITLASRTGTEINVRDLAMRLLARGHAPLVYTPDPGEVAAELHAAGVPVVDDLGRVDITPDVIHGHHHPETMTALLHFPGVPAIFFSHDALGWQDAAPLFPRILRYVAVDEANRDRLVREHGIAEDRVRVILNAVDLDRFTSRRPLPRRPRRALFFNSWEPMVAAIEVACRAAGVALDVMGAGAGAPSAAPERILGQYDLVFARGRCALEALAVGTAVVLCGYGCSGPLVTAAELEQLRPHNFGRRLLHEPATAAALEREIARYDAGDAAEVSRRIRASAGLDAQVDELVALYHEVIAENALRVDDPRAEERAAGVYLRAWGPRFRDGLLRAEGDRLRRECERLQIERDELELRSRATEERYRAREQEYLAEIDRIRADRDRSRSELAYVLGTATWRLREVLLRSRSLAAAYRAIRRALAAVPRGRAVSTS